MQAPKKTIPVKDALRAKIEQTSPDATPAAIDRAAVSGGQSRIRRRSPARSAPVTPFAAMAWKISRVPSYQRTGVVTHGKAVIALQLRERSVEAFGGQRAVPQ
jgi:hypothetical protein